MSGSPIIPRDYGELKKAIAFRGGRGPRQMQRVANCIQSRPEIFVFGSVATVAAATGVSPASLVRFCQLVGLTGFAQLREILRNDLMDTLHVDRVSLSRPGATFKLTLRHILDLNIRASEALNNSLTENAISDFIDVIHRADTIFVLGEGRFYPIALALHQMFGKARIRSYLATRDETAAEDILGFAGKGDALVEIAATSSVDGAPTRVSARIIRQINPTAGESGPSMTQLMLSDNGSMQGSLIALCQALTLWLQDARSMT